MRKFTFFLTMLVAMVTTSMAQSYELTETRLTSSDLNSKTEPTLIAIKNLSKTNNYWFVGNTGAAPYSAAEFSEDAVFVWEPIAPGVPGVAYCLKKLDGTYMTTVSPAEFSAESGAAALFTTANPTVANGGFNGDGDSMPYIDDEALLVRFVNATGTWINVQNGDAGTPVYNNGTGGWTIHNVYLVEEKEETVEPEPEPEPEPAGPVVITSVEQLSNSKLYTITSSDAGRGNFYALDSKVDMCAVTYNAGSDACHSVAYNAEDPKQQFAFVAYEGKHYLYSVSEKKFVAKNGDVNQLTAEAPFEFVVVESVSENTFALMLNGTNYMTASPGWCANPNRATCLQTTLTDHNSDNGWDAGAWYTITEVGTFDATEALAMLAPAAPEPEPTVQTFAVEAALFPTPQGDVTEIRGIRVEANQGPSLSDFPTGWTLTNEAGNEYEMQFQWLYDWETVLIMVNPAITEAGTYTLTIPAGSLKTDDGKECEAATFSWTIEAAVVEPEPEPEVVPAANKSYTVVAEGHSKGNSPQWAINDEGTKFVSSGDNAISTEEQKQFAFVAYEENTYLYSVSAKKFVMKDASLSDATPDAIEIVKLDNGKFFFRFDANHNINIGGSEQMIIDNWNIVDGGNQYTLNAVADFDATEALELLAPVEPELPALEITGYTPTEAVESLETITITFNDEIEGTFDMMAMSQIYLGSRSNGCSFAVEGNVLTITPFNAITTPGEYGLVIPEGLITRKANGENISLNKEIVFTVKEATVEPEPEVTYYRIKTTTATGDAIYLNIGNTDEHQTGPKGGVNVVAYAEDDNQLFTIEEAAEGWCYLKSKSGYYIKGWEWNVDGSADQKTEIKFEDAGDGYFYILNKNEKKGAELYFKVEWVGDNYYPFCDVNGTAGAAKWTLEQVGAAEPELPALEITGYTPTEAVESLETITITFNDEIEGTFDMMAMSQIYLGSKSNGCSFAVEGNVLTITPFNAITTPGEYGLVIPAGLITRKANGEAIALNGEITFTVKEATVEPEPTVPVVITSVDQLSNSKLYTIVSSDLGRGGMFAGEGASLVDMCGVTYNQAQDCHSIAMDAADPRQQFAFVEYEGKHYLYSVSEKKFVAKNGNVNKLTAEAPFEFVVVESVSENTFALMLNGTHYMTASPGWCSNAERNTCIQTTLTDHNSDNGWDNGAWFTITEVGEFDATEAIAMLTPAEPEVEPLEVVSISPADGETVEKLEQIVVTFNAPVTLDETKNINLVAIEGSDVTPIEAYVGTWQLFSSFPEQEGYFVTGTTEIIEYQGQPALLCKGFADMANYGYDDSFIMFYNSEDGSVTLPAQNCENFEYNGYSYEVGLYIGNSTELRIFNGKLIGKYVDGVIIFEGSPENEHFSDSFMFYAPDMGTISYFNDVVWMPVSQAAAPAKAAVRNNVKVECAKNLSVATIAKSKISRADENVASIVSATINPDDATQLIITVNQPLANDTYKLVIEAGAVVTAQGATNETIICTYILNAPTGIDEVKGESGEVKAIYDLTGRKIETITKGGIYIVNGKKVLVK